MRHPVAVRLAASAAVATCVATVTSAQHVSVVDASRLTRPPVVMAREYYVSPAGDDRNPGTLAQPWQTIGQVNATSFVAGDRIHFEGGQAFPGNLAFGADDLGTAADPIVVDSYGTGRAILDAGTGKGVSIYDTAGIELNQLVVRGGWDAASQSGNAESGIELYMDLPGTVRLPHVVVQDVEVSGFMQTGIVVGAWATDATMSGFTDVLIERCDSHDNGDAGIASWGYWDPASSDYSHRNIVVRRCRAFGNHGLVGAANNTGNGIVLSGVDGAVIEQSEAFQNGDLCDHRGGGPVGIWCWDARNVVIQANESHHNRTGAASLDGGGFDLDGGVTNSIVQYNWSHDNDGAGYLVYQFGGARPSLSGNVVRYNVSQDDARQHAIAALYIGGGPEVHDNQIYQNTIFISPSGNPGISAVVLDGVGAGNELHGNIVMTTGGVNLVSSDQRYARTSVAIQGNLWWAGAGGFRVMWGGLTIRGLGAWRAVGQETLGATPVGLEADPLLTNPGGGATIGDPDALATLGAYVPLAGSPVIDTGLDLLGAFGIDPGTRDFAGNSIPQGAAFDLGAFELAGGCTLPGVVGDTLRVSKPSPDILFTWQDIALATSYNVHEDVALPSAFVALTGSAASGSTGLRAPMPAGSLVFYVVAGQNACGEGPR